MSDAEAIASIANAIGSVFNGRSGARNAEKSAYKQYLYQLALMKEQAQTNYKYAQYSAIDSPSWNRQGLEKAGYNPMLAVQNATSGVNSSWASQANGPKPEINEGITAGISNAQSFQRLANETATAESSADLNYAEADNTKIEKAERLARLPYVSKQAKADYNKTLMESSNLENEIHNRDESIRLIESGQRLQQKLTEMGVNAQIRGQDKAYNATKYAADVQAETQRGTIESRTPFGFGSRKYYQSDDVMRMPIKRHEGSYIDYNDKRYWHYY